MKYVADNPLKTKLSVAIDVIQRVARQWQMATNSGKTSFNPNALIRYDCESHPAQVPAAPTETSVRYDLATQTNSPTKGKDSAAPAPGGPAPSPQEPKTCDTQITIDRYGTFLAALASYTLELAKAGKATADTRAAFQNAALDIIQTDGPRTGFDRGWGWNFLWPKPAIRFSWSPGYVNETTHDGLRYVVTLDWPTVRVPLRYTQWTYLAINVSVFDLLGPFSEAALRKQTSIQDSALQWYDVINPRAELMYGIPSFTTHLALVAAVSYRGAAVAKTGADGATLKYFSPYQTLYEGTFPTDYTNGKPAFYSQFIETSLGIKYLP